MKINNLWLTLLVYAFLARCSNDAGPAAAVPHRIARNLGQVERVRSARELTSRYEHSRFVQWHVQAKAAGDLCNVLVIQTPVVMDASMVDAMHGGKGEYDLGESVQSFYLEAQFRGVVYLDGSRRVWTYGAVKQSEVEELEPCR